MLIFCHLFTGLVLGLLIYKLSGQRWTLWACGLGSVLPDLIDKPLGHILLEGSLDNGRLYSHTLLFLVIISIAGLAIWKSHGKFVILALAAGILLHQVADTMYLFPIGWGWPAFGPFVALDYGDYFGDSIVKELSTIYEWFFGLVSVAIVLQFALKDGWIGWRLLMRRRSGLTILSWTMAAFALISVLVGLFLWNGGSDFGVTGAWYISALAAAAGVVLLELSLEE